MAHIRLAAIMRNEAKALPGLALAVLPYIDSWCLVDNGPSTDGSQELAKELFGHLPGQVHQSRLEVFDFASARNEMLDIAGGPGVYLLLLDPDSPPTGTIDKTALTEPAYSARARDPYGCEWDIPTLLLSGTARYVGRAHEYLALAAEAPPLPDFYIERKSAGCDAKRAEWIIQVLSEEPDNPRAVFYLANTLRDVGRRREAVEMYVRRAAMVGWAQETFWAIYQAGVVLTETDKRTAARIFLDAHAYRPSRAEPLHALARMHNGHGEHHAALAFAEKGLALPPSTDALFVERWVERYGLAFEAAVAKWWLGERDDAFACWERLLGAGEMRPEYNELAKKNLALRG